MNLSNPNHETHVFIIIIIYIKEAEEAARDFLCTDVGNFKMVIWSKICMDNKRRMKMRGYGNRYEKEMKGGG